MKIVVIAVLILASSSMLSQATSGASSKQVQIGAEGSYFAPDYAQSVNEGVGVYTSIDFTGQHVGFEGDAFQTVKSARGIRESYYLVGPRYYLHYGSFRLYGKSQVGLGHFNGVPGKVAKQQGNYFDYSFGGGVELNAVKHVSFRLIDSTYQFLPGFPKNGLTPWMLSSGVAYRF